MHIETVYNRQIQVYLKDYITTSALVCFYYDDTDIIIPGHNPQKPPLSLMTQEVRNSSLVSMEATLERQNVSDMIKVSEAQSDLKLEKILSEFRLAEELQISRFESIGVQISKLTDEITGTRSESKSNRNVLLVTILPTIVATGFAILAILVAAQANLLSAFQAGVALRSAPVEQPSKNA